MQCCCITLFKSSLRIDHSKRHSHRHSHNRKLLQLQHFAFWISSANMSSAVFKHTFKESICLVVSLVVTAQFACCTNAVYSLHPLTNLCSSLIFPLVPMFMSSFTKPGDKCRCFYIQKHFQLLMLMYLFIRLCCLSHLFINFACHHIATKITY